MDDEEGRSMQGATQVSARFIIGNRNLSRGEVFGSGEENCVRSGCTLVLVFWLASCRPWFLSTIAPFLLYRRTERQSSM